MANKTYKKWLKNAKEALKKLWKIPTMSDGFYLNVIEKRSKFTISDTKVEIELLCIWVAQTRQRIRKIKKTHDFFKFREKI